MISKYVLRMPLMFKKGVPVEAYSIYQCQSNIVDFICLDLMNFKRLYHTGFDTRWY